MKKLIYIIALTLLITACGEDKVGKVNGKAISAAQFDAYLEHKRIAIRDDAQREKLVDQYLHREALANVIEKEAFKGDKLIQAELNELRKEIVISRYFERFLKDKVTDDAIINYYNSNSENYSEKKVHVAHILLRLNRNMDEVQRKAQLTTAQEAASKIQAGMSFSEAAGKYSEDKISGKKGGDLGWLKEGSIHKAFSEKAFALKKGEISAPLETPFGFHIMTVLEEPKVVKRSLEATKGEIRHQLRNQAKQAEMTRLSDNIKVKK